MRARGTLRHWNESKGYGFLKRDDGEADLFIGRKQLPHAQHQHHDRICFSNGNDLSMATITISITGSTIVSLNDNSHDISDSHLTDLLTWARATYQPTSTPATRTVAGKKIWQV